MSKVIAVMDKPENCQSCVFGVCKYSHPFWSKDRPSTKGYYCQLLPSEQRVVQDFNYDAEVHLDNCPLVPLPEKQNDDNLMDEYMDGYDFGWNSCIDAITGK